MASEREEVSRARAGNSILVEGGQLVECEKRLVVSKINLEYVRDNFWEGN